MESCSPESRARVMAGRSTTKTAPQPGLKSWGGRVNSPSLRGAAQPQRKALPPREEWHARARRWAQAGPIATVSCNAGNPRNAPSDARSRFRYQYLHLLLPCTIEVLAVLGEDVNSGLRQALLRPGWKRFDFGLPVFLSLRKIVIELHLQPKLGRRVRHRLGKPHAHRH